MPPGCGNDGGGHTVDLEMNGGGRECGTEMEQGQRAAHRLARPLRLRRCPMPRTTPAPAPSARPSLFLPWRRRLGEVSAVDEACATSATGPLGLPARISGSPSSPTLVGSSSIHG